MLPITHPLNTPRGAFRLNDPNLTKENSAADPQVINLESRIEENRELIEGLKIDAGFQNILSIMYTSAVPDEQFVNFLTGKASLEECVGKNENRGRIDGLLMIYHPFDKIDFKYGFFGKPHSHFFNKSLSDKFAAILKHGYSESDEKTRSKIATLMQAIKEKKYSGEFMSAENEINYALSMVEKGRPHKAIEMCKAIYNGVIKDHNQRDITIITNKLLEAGLEILLFGDEKTAIDILKISNGIAHNTRHYWQNDAADACSRVLNRPAFIKSFDLDSEEPSTKAFISNYLLKSVCIELENMKKLLTKAVIEKEYLKCAPYFLGKVYREGLYNCAKDEVKAKEFFAIAAERGYEPGKLVLMREQGEEYKLMRAAQQSNESVFSLIPRDLVNYISSLRVKAILAQSEREKMTGTMQF
jgi:hypothetical protein